ncbi:hypothetical protein LDG_6262 [Legionella drancourtii LLAP12]|uniref:Uncharacterized protein n=1 Tax=Legionella drancourtii LLAP12 TaxID=658187 RepID=G9EM01_9GAMM|nr:hypothetical protein LDG_6262 [Legionella drancourtii LLAP12]
MIKDLRGMNTGSVIEGKRNLLEYLVVDVSFFNRIKIP